jgi:hypothetical protein
MSAPDQVYRVFLSSADKSDSEAREYRLAAKKLIETEFKQRFSAVDMSEFDPSEQSSLEVCRAKVLECYL